MASTENKEVLFIVAVTAGLLLGMPVVIMLMVKYLHFLDKLLF